MHGLLFLARLTAGASAFGILFLFLPTIIPRFAIGALEPRSSYEATLSDLTVLRMASISTLTIDSLQSAGRNYIRYLTMLSSFGESSVVGKKNKGSTSAPYVTKVCSVISSENSAKDFSRFSIRMLSTK